MPLLLLHDRRGMTLFEILLVVGLFLVIVAASFPIYSQLQTGAHLLTVSRDMIETFHTAQVRSFSRLNDSAHGIYVDTAAKRYTLFQGASYAARNADYDQNFSLPPTVQVATTLTGSQVVFSLQLGRPSNIGTISLTDARGQSKVITLGPLGSLDLN